MATAFTEEDLLKCAICFELYTEPRKLPRCGHTFCELCLLTYARTLEKNNELNSEFPCPFCRASIPGPRSKTLTDWIKSFASDTKMLSKLHVHRDKTAIVTCSPCTELGNSSAAEHYCVECAENLCKSCAKVHTAFKLSKQHNVVKLLRDTIRMKSECDLVQMLDRYKMCSEHDDKSIEFYCRNHNSLFCITCAILHHRQCDHVFELSKSVSKSQNESDAAELQADIGKLSKHANSIVQSLTNADEANKKEATNIIAEIRQIKVKIVKQLEVLEENLTKETNALLKRYAFGVDHGTGRAKEVIRELHVLQSLLHKVLNGGTDTETYILIHKLRRRIGDLKSSISDTGSTFASYGLELKLTSMLTNLLAIGTGKTDKLATVRESRKPIVIPVLSEKLMTYSPAVHIKKSCTKYVEGEVSNPTYCGLIFIVDELLLLDSYTNKCNLVDGSWKVCSSLSLPDEPASITNLRNGLIAVSFPVLQKIFLISADDELTIKRELSTKFSPKAICALQNGDLAVSWENPVAFGIVWPYSDLPEKEYFSQDKTGRKLKSFDYMAIDEKRSHVIQPCISDKAVFCFDFEGNAKYKYTNGELKKPRGVALDSCGNAYVCESATSSVHVISPTGQPVCIVKEEFLKTPLAIGFNSKGDKFAVTQLYFGCCYVTFFEVNQGP